MENKKVVKNEVKFNEYKAVLQIIKETIGDESPVRFFMRSEMLKKLAGYSEEYDEEQYNPYIRDYLDKALYDEHCKEVEEAKSANDKEALQALSDKVMKMAGYIRDESFEQRNINTYAKSFVDRQLIKNYLDKACKSESQNDMEGMKDAYSRIYKMSSYSSSQPYGVVNDYAQGFVEAKRAKYKELGISIPQKQEITEQYAI